MNNGKHIRRVAAVVAVTAVGVAGWSGLARANGTGTHGISRVEESNVAVEDPIRIRTWDDAQVIVAHIQVEPGGHTPWHYHPGPHLVTVKTGTVSIYETDCSERTYKAGEGFFDPGSTWRPHVHTLVNPDDVVTAEIVITDIRQDDLRPTVVADPQPQAACF